MLWGSAWMPRSQGKEGDRAIYWIHFLSPREPATQDTAAARAPRRFARHCGNAPESGLVGRRSQASRSGERGYSRHLLRKRLPAAFDATPLRCAELCEVAPCLDEADRVGTSAERRIRCLHVVVLPIADRADVEGAWWFLIQREEATAETGMALVHRTLQSIARLAAAGNRRETRQADSHTVRGDSFPPASGSGITLP